jgi:hypothetical protein
MNAVEVHPQPSYSNMNAVEVHPQLSYSNMNAVKVHPRPSNNKHSVDGAFVSPGGVKCLASTDEAHLV